MIQSHLNYQTEIALDFQMVTREKPNGDSGGVLEGGSNGGF
jgi:hypothetical protein